MIPIDDTSQKRFWTGNFHLPGSDGSSREGWPSAGGYRRDCSAIPPVFGGVAAGGFAKESIRRRGAVCAESVGGADALLDHGELEIENSATEPANRDIAIGLRHSRASN